MDLIRDRGKTTCPSWQCSEDRVVGHILFTPVTIEAGGR